MVEIGNVKEVIKDYIVKQLVSMGESSPAIRLLTPLAKRAITNNIDSFDKFLKPIADKNGMIDIEGIFDEEMEIINSIDNFDFDIPFIGGGNISKGIISLEIPYVNKIVALNQTDLETLTDDLSKLMKNDFIPHNNTGKGNVTKEQFKTMPHSEQAKLYQDDKNLYNSLIK